MKKFVKKCLDNCIECLQHNYKNITNEGYLHSIDKGDRPFDTLHLDHLKIPEKSRQGHKYILCIVDAFSKIPEKSRQGHKYILCIVDAFSKFTFLEPTKTTNATEVLKVMYQLTKIFGRPRRIITDRGTAFTSQAFVQFCAEHNIKLVHVAVQTPRANGQWKSLTKVIMPALLKENETDAEWTGSLIKIQLPLNSTLQRSIGKTPAEVFFGYKLDLLQYASVENQLQEELRIHDFVKNRDETRMEATKQNEKVQKISYRKN
ncbi:Integrase core domain [Popillia japonica]|uniref:Integrase core domain n=1 Tax=Popillia japonica TaxID=7064 RepID=A0AAW1KMG2_POPJA